METYLDTNFRLLAPSSEAAHCRTRLQDRDPIQGLVREPYQKETHVHHSRLFSDPWETICTFGLNGNIIGTRNPNSKKRMSEDSLVMNMALSFMSTVQRNYLRKLGQRCRRQPGLLLKNLD